MAIRDLSGNDVPEAGLDYDLCLIGAGAAGISIAQALAGGRLSVCLLESGGLHGEADTQSLYEGDVAGHAMTMEVGRYRVLGGSTSQWTGRCGMLDPIDFAQRPWVPHSGWPIGLDDLMPYYRAARMVCGFAQPWIDDDDATRALGVPELADAGLTNFVWRYAPIGNRVYRDWGVEYRRLLDEAPNVDTILHANMTRWHASPDGGRVEGVTVSTLDGRQRVVRARAFVLCAGGLESTRLLLSSDDDVPNAPGTIDSDYRGELKVILVNLGTEAFSVLRGDRVAQLVVAPVVRASWLKFDELDDTTRGEGGFGSTGGVVALGN